MTFLVLTVSAFFTAFFIVTVTTTMFTINLILTENQKTRPKKYERSRSNKKRYEKDVKVDELKTEEPLRQASTQTIKSLQEELEEINQELERSIHIELCLKKLEYLKRKYPNETRILWMIGKANQKLAFLTEDSNVRKYHIQKGIAACQASLDLNYNQAEAHKWMAVLIGLKGETQSTKEKIESGKLFKKHLDTAIDLNPRDPYLKHLAGRFCYEISSLNWVEKKLANSVFPEPLNCTYDTALEQLLQSERIYEPGWKENRLFIAKCYIAKKNYTHAVEWLRKAKSTADYYSTDKIDEEINNLLKQYHGYR